jgi:hypothetical protein
MRESLSPEILSIYPQFEMIVGAGEQKITEFLPRPAVVRNIKSGDLRMDFGETVEIAPGVKRLINQDDRSEVLSEAPEWTD